MRGWAMLEGTAAIDEVKLMLLVKTTIMLLLLCLTAGCTTLQSTPQQAYTYDIAAPCRTMGFVDYFGAEPDGTYFVSFRGTGPAVFSAPTQFKQCMQDEQRLHPYAEWVKKNWSVKP